jgi:hypothetical protein
MSCDDIREMISGRRLHAHKQRREIGYIENVVSLSRTIVKIGPMKSGLVEEQRIHGGLSLKRL